MIVNIKYRVDIEELAQATVDFVRHRPLMRLMRLIMSITATLLVISFAMRMYLRYPTNFSDLASALFALSWLLFYQTIHKQIILRTLRKRSIPNLELDIQVTNQQIHVFNNQDHNNFKLSWKGLKFIAKNSLGYILPLTGLTNAGKFIWLPIDTLQATQQEEAFLKLATQFNIKIHHY